MTRFHRSVLHRAGNTTSIKNVFPSESRCATQTFRKNVESAKPWFSLKGSVCALLLAMGGVGSLNVASALEAPGAKAELSGCEKTPESRYYGSDDFENWTCRTIGEEGSVGLINMDVSRELLEHGDRPRPEIREDAVVIGRVVRYKKGENPQTYNLGSVSIGAGARAEAHGVAIGENAASHGDPSDPSSKKLRYGRDDRFQIVKQYDTDHRYGAIAIGDQAMTHIESEVVIGTYAGKGAQGIPNAFDSGRQRDFWLYSLGSSVMVGADAGRDATYRGAVFLGTRAGQSSQGVFITAIGEGAAYGLNGNRNIAIGENALGKVLPYLENVDIRDGSNFIAAEGDANFAAGSIAGAASRGSNNTFIGESAGVLFVGDHNIAMGASSGFLTQGSGNVLLGRHATGSAEGFYYSGSGRVENADTPYAIVNDAVSIGSESNVRGDNSVAIGHTSTADKAGIAIGTNAIATTAGGVAIGKGAVEGAANPIASATIKGATYQYAGIAPESVVSVGNVGTERQITNVAAGRISATSTDAINGSQLFAVHRAIEMLNAAATAPAPTPAPVLATDGGGAGDGASANGGGSWNLQINGDTPTIVAASATVGLNAGSNIQLAHDGNNVSVSTTPNIKVDSVKADTVTANSVTTDSIITNSVTAGTVAAADALRITDGPALSSVGIDAANKIIINVAEGEQDHDAVNVAQLNRSTRDLSERIDRISNSYNGQVGPGVNDRTEQVVSGLNERIGKVASGLNARIDRVAAEADAGSASASAIANLPQAYVPGKNAFAIATAGYRGQQGYAAGLSRVSPSGNWIVKGSLSGNSRGHLVYGAGVAYQW